MKSNLLSLSIITLTAILIIGCVPVTPAPSASSAPTSSDEAVSLDGTAWALVSYGDPTDPQAVAPNSEVTAEFADGDISGNASCNTYNATIELSNGAITIGPARTTRMACREFGEQEQTFLAALSTASSYEMAGDELRISYDDGAGMLTFVGQG